MRVNADSGSPWLPVHRISCSFGGSSSRSCGRHVHVAEVARDVRVLAHRAPHDANLAPEADRDVDRLLHAVHVRGERRDEDAPLPQREDLPERLADDPFGRREPGALRVRGVAEQQVDPPVAEVGEPADVRLQPVDGRVVELVVACMDDAPGGRLQHDRGRVGNRVGHAHELDPERPQLARRIVGVHLAELGCAQQAVLVQLGLDQPERQACRPDLGDAHLSHQIGQRPDVVLMAVREDDGADRAGAVTEVGEVGQDEIDAEVLVPRERQAGVHDDDVAAALVDRHVLADLAEAPERDDLAGFSHHGPV
jgi:hypothetical protein